MNLRKEIELAVKDKTGKNIANINSLPLNQAGRKSNSYYCTGSKSP